MDDATDNTPDFLDLAPEEGDGTTRAEEPTEPQPDADDGSPTSDTPAQPPLSENAPAPAPSHTAQDPSGESEAPRRKRGRPKGSTDKQPRKPRKGPFAGAVAGDGPGEVQKGKARPKAKAKDRGALPLEEIVAMSASELAEFAVGIGNGIIVRVGAIRYGPEAMGLSLTDEEAAKITPLAARFIESLSITLTPGEALAFALVGVYGTKAIQLEAERRARAADGEAA